MKDQTWALLDHVRETMKAPHDVPPGLMIGLASRIEEAITSPSAEMIHALSRQLVEFNRALLRVVPPEAAKAAWPEAPAPLAGAYLLGQIGFAQALASQVADKRVDERFVATLQDPKYTAYIDALLRKPLTGRDLADQCREAEETVSRKLKALRTLGIAEFRREGTRLVNFLTPAARTVVEHLRPAPVEPSTPAIATSKVRNTLGSDDWQTIPLPPLLEREQGQLEPYLQKLPKFTRSVITLEARR